MILLLKGARLPEGATTLKHNYKTGRTYLYKKVNGKWVYVKGQETSGRVTKGKKWESSFNKLKFNPTVMQSLEKRNISSLDDLKNYVSENSRDESTKLFREVADNLKKDSGSSGMKYSVQVMTSFGKMMSSIIRDKKPKKITMTVKVTTKTGNTYRRQKSNNPSVDKFPASVVKESSKIMGSWKSVNSMPTTRDIQGIISAGNGTVLKGKMNKSGTWRLPKKMRDDRYNPIVIPFRPNEKGIKITLHQIKKNSKRDSIQAAVQITVPYAHAESFLRAHVTSSRLLNDRINQMKRSSGYKNALASISSSEAKKEASA